VEDGLTRAEALWLRAVERLEAVGGGGDAVSGSPESGGK